jgi:phosphoenolpyruvate phosphomutase
VIAFCAEWANRSPVVVVPTTYYTTPTDVFRSHSISVVIWANHLMRAAIKSMQSTASTIHDEESLLSIDDSIVPVTEIFRLQGAKQLQHAETMYLPKRATGTRAVVLAASRGAELGSLTEHRPKTMVGIAGKPLLEHIACTYKAAGVNDITVVRGYRKEAVTVPHVNYVDNDEFASTGELASLGKALEVLPADTETLIVSYGDVLFRKYIPEMLLDETTDEFVIAVDTNWRESVNRNRAADYVTCSVPYSRRNATRDVFLRHIAAEVAEDQIHGEWMGFVKCGRRGIMLVRETTAAASRKSATMQTLFRELIARGEPIRVIYTTGHWLDIDSLEDVVTAGSFR